MRFNSVRLLVSNLNECFRFYRDTMGFAPDWGDEGSTYANFQMADGTSLALFQRRLMAEAVGTTDLPAAVAGQDRVALIFEVEDVDATVAGLRARGARFVTEPRDYPDWTIRAAHLRDPDGNLIEIYSPLPESKWTAQVAEEARKYQR